MGIAFGKLPFSYIALTIKTHMWNSFSGTCTALLRLGTTSRANHLDSFAFSSQARVFRSQTRNQFQNCGLLVKIDPVISISAEICSCQKREKQRDKLAFSVKQFLTCPCLYSSLKDCLCKVE